MSIDMNNPCINDYNQNLSSQPTRYYPKSQKGTGELAKQVMNDNSKLVKESKSISDSNSTAVNDSK